MPVCHGIRLDRNVHENLSLVDTKIDAGIFQYDLLNSSEVTSSPFPYLIIPGFVSGRACESIRRDYPTIQQNGSFPLEELQYGPAFQDLITELNGDRFREIIEDKFNISLKDRSTITTVRGQCALKDGRIHTDSVTKIITVLLYMNHSWDQSEGRLRLLNSSKNLDDYFVEVPPMEGTLLVFKVTDKSWHGHLPFEGQRRVIQFNWLVSEGSAKRNHFRHRVTAKIKKTLNYFSNR